MNYKELDTPALLIDRDIMMKNLQSMQQYANVNKVSLRPHTKTHKIPEIAIIQEELGANGITVAKLGEAEVMAESGLTDIFIANQVVGRQKIERIRELSDTIEISFGIDDPSQLPDIEEVFEGSGKKAKVLIEIEVGEERSGIIEESDFVILLNELKKSKNIDLKGIFSHDGHSYMAEDLEECKDIFYTSVARTLRFAELANENGFHLEVVSIGSTPSLIQGYDIPSGVTEIRPGTYVFMDASQANVINSYNQCAATILTTVISKPTRERVITDVGAKGITAQTRSKGITKTTGLGRIKDYDEVYIYDVYDEHAIIYNEKFNKEVKIGDKIEIIPNHICPVCNLHEKAYLISEGKVFGEYEVKGRGKLQ
ncbi:alanine racemase [Sporosarcina sp. P37]|uniref:D-TA family PLP-dependent enzyme n=1 Tax=unclassified Sporosarcina TaxID=2647733 RepID=UPI000A179D6D|nr:MULTISPECIES: D-TA family PLP-dependent enzyme [unclassified Sporosarcina]ARK25369.1 alanine racemase [Sporosarcina sp. P37]PID19076.1 alanine racemase [Sporosarcina sp. P35]